MAGHLAVNSFQLLVFSQRRDVVAGMAGDKSKPAAFKPKAAAPGIVLSGMDSHTLFLI
jgi:hypothetical protein